MEDEKTFEIINEVETVKNRILKFRTDISNKNVIACLGNTRSGKSTLINFILDNDLTSFAKGKFFLIKSESTGNGPCIKHGCVSHTKYPSIWQSQKGVDTIVVDFPGFDDTRGIVRNIINNVFTNQLTYARSVKFVVVTDIKDIINDNINEFTKLMTNLESILIDFNAVSLIFTKASDDIVVANICSLMTEKILNVDQLAVKKDLITHLTENHHQIGILKAPVRAGLIDSEEIDCNVKITTNNNNFTHGNYQFILSDCTHLILLDVYQKCVDGLDFQVEVNSIITTFQKYFDIDKYVFASTDQELENTQNRLTILLENIREQNALFFTMLRGVYESVSALIQGLSDPFKKILKFLKFMDELSLLDENIKSIVINRYRHVLSELTTKVTKLLEKIRAELVARLEEGFEHLKNVVCSDARMVAAAAAVYIPLVKTTLDVLGHDFSWISWELVEASAGTFGIGVLGVASFGAGAYAVHYSNTTHLRKKLRKEQGRS